jgi:hypothetical protein
MVIFKTDLQPGNPNSINKTKLERLGYAGR